MQDLQSEVSQETQTCLSTKEASIKSFLQGDAGEEEGVEGGTVSLARL